MDLLQVYASSSDEENERNTKIESDYFGLLSSDSDNEHANFVSNSVDTYINAFKLRSDEVGPANQLIDQEQTKRSKYQKVDQRNKRRKRLKGEENPAVSQDDLKLRLELSVTPHPLISKFFCKNFNKSKLPEESNLRTEMRHKSCVNSVEWGTQVSSAHLLLSASMDGSVKIFNAITKAKEDQELNLRYHNIIHDGQAVRCARWHPTHNSILTGGFDKNVVLTDIIEGKEIERFSHPDYVYCLKVNPYEPNMFVSGSSSAAYCWDIRQNSKTPTRTYSHSCSDVKDVEFLPGGMEFVCCSTLVTRESADKNIIVWDLRSGALLSNQIFHERYHCTSLKVHPDGKQFLAQTNGDYIALFSTKSPYKLNKNLRYEGHKVQGYWIGFDVSKDGKLIYSGSADGKLYIYNNYNGDICRTLRISNKPLISVQSHSVLPNTVALSDFSGNIHIIY
ncbi:WD repeat-containing protein 25 [Chamberlinius hualienensis]